MMLATMWGSMADRSIRIVLLIWCGRSHVADATDGLAAEHIADEWTRYAPGVADAAMWPVAVVIGGLKRGLALVQQQVRCVHQACMHVT